MDVVIDTDGFQTTDIVNDKECVTFRTNVKCKEEFKRWKDLFCVQNRVSLNIYRMYSVGQRKLFHQLLICHHGTPHKGVKKTYTGCKVFMDVTIKKVHSRSPAHVKAFPCFVKIRGNHNHPLDTVDFLNQLKVSSSTREMFESYFRLGMTQAQAYRHHMLKMDLSDDLDNQANKSINPSQKSIEYMCTVWSQSERGGLNNPSVFHAINSYAIQNPELIVKISPENEQFCVVVVTPFMMRAHRLLEEAGQVVFVDTTGRVDKLKTAVIPFLCAGPAGAVPLAVVVTTAQDEATLTKGFGMVKEAVGDYAFNGRQEPQSFMTGDCNAIRKALAVAWPTSQQFLCTSHIVQQAWRWLLHSKHSIRKDDRQELMAGVKSLVYAESIEAFDGLLEEIQNNPLTHKYNNFKSYLASLVQRREDWSTAFRVGSVLRGHHTNNYYQATMCILKDNVLNRYKTYNSGQLVVFMAEIFDRYMSQHLVDVAMSRRRIKSMIVDALPLEAVQPLPGGIYQVENESDLTKHYEVDLNVGTCTCNKGSNGAVCKHQAVCADYGMSVVPQQLELNNYSRQQLVILAHGEENAPLASFFKPLKEEQSEEITQENWEVGFEGSSSNDYCIETQIKTETPEVTSPSNITDQADSQTNIPFGLERIMQHIMSVETTNQLNSFMNSAGSSATKRSWSSEDPLPTDTNYTEPKRSCYNW